MATEIAKAYVQIIPTTKGITGELEKQLGGAGESAGKSVGAKIGGFLVNGIKDTLKASAKAIGAGLLGSVVGVGKIIKDSISEYANFEQLTGGVEKLFGDAAPAIKASAEEAFKSAGLSANEYMETVTSFSASLIGSLGGDTAAAADMADMAIRDMADNANVYGSDLSSVQAAYQNFAKQNYSLLDNLKLGYGGSQAEAYRLLSDAAALNEEFAKTANFSIDSTGHLEAGYADIVQAIHIVQTEMGITGTTALEASRTISGSVASMKSAWKNLITDLGNGNADLSGSIDALLSTILGEDGKGGVINNIKPVLEQAASGIGQILSEIAPIISDALPPLIDAILPDLLDAAVQLVIAFATAIIDNLPIILDAVFDVISQLGEAIWERLEPVYSDVIAPFFTEIFDAVGGFFTGIWDSISSFFENTWNGISTFFKTIYDGIVAFFNDPFYYIGYALGYIAGLVTNAVKGIWDFIKNDVPRIIDDVVTWVSELPEKIWTWLNETISKAADFVVELGKKGLEAAKSIIGNIVEGVKELPSKMLEIGKNIVDGVWNGIKGKAEEFMANVKSFFSGIVDGVKNALGIASPSKVFAGIGGYMAQGLSVGFSGEIDSVQREIAQDMRGLVGTVGSTTIGLNASAVPSNAVYAGGSTYNITIDAANVREFNDIVSIAQNARVNSRKARVSPVMA